MIANELQVAEDGEFARALPFAKESGKKLAAGIELVDPDVLLIAQIQISQIVFCRQPEKRRILSVDIMGIYSQDLRDIQRYLPPYRLPCVEDMQNAVDELGFDRRTPFGPFAVDDEQDKNNKPED
jgi:hypothetical protein